MPVIPLVLPIFETGYRRLIENTRRSYISDSLHIAIKSSDLSMKKQPPCSAALNNVIRVMLTYFASHKRKFIVLSSFEIVQGAYFARGLRRRRLGGLHVHARVQCR